MNHDIRGVEKSLFKALEPRWLGTLYHDRRPKYERTRESYAGGGATPPAYSWGTHRDRTAYEDSQRRSPRENDEDKRSRDPELVTVSEVSVPMTPVKTVLS